jgi:hypothetical protein
MTDPNSPRKPRRRGLVLPFLLAGVLVVGWTGWWLYLRGEVEKRLDAGVADLKAEGYDVSWGSRSIGGYPFRILVRFEAVNIDEPTGYGLSATVLEAEAAAYSANPIVLASPDTLIVRRPGNKGFVVRGKTLRASLSHLDRTPPRLSVEGVDLQFAAMEGREPLSFSAMERMEFHLRPNANEADTADVFLRLKDATPANNDLLARVTDGKPVTLGLEGKVTGASFLRGDGWREVAQSWSRAKGVFTVDKGGVAAGEAVLSVQPSTLGVDENGHLTGKLSLSLTKASDGVLALGAVGVLPKETAAVASGLTGVQPPGGRPLEASLTFAGGRTLLGPLPLGPAPKVY